VQKKKQNLAGKKYMIGEKEDIIVEKLLSMKS